MLLQSFVVLSYILDGDVAFDRSNGTIRKSAIICTCNKIIIIIIIVPPSALPASSHFLF
jgi:hypothetical protein